MRCGKQDDSFPCQSGSCCFTGAVSNNSQAALVSTASQSIELTPDEATRDSAAESPLDTAERPQDSAGHAPHPDTPTTGLLFVNPAHLFSPALLKTRLQAAAAQLALDSQFQTPGKRACKKRKSSLLLSRSLIDLPALEPHKHLELEVGQSCNSAEASPFCAIYHDQYHEYWIAVLPQAAPMTAARIQQHVCNAARLTQASMLLT